MAMRTRKAARWRRLAMYAALMFAASATPALAQVVLNPAIVQGTIELTGQTISNAYVYANWTDMSTNPPTNYSASASVTGNTYSMIVNVPQGTTPTYTVNAYANVNGTNQQFYFASQTVNPDPAVPQTLNFVVNPGIIQGTVTPTGNALSYFYIYAGSSYSYFNGSPGTYSLFVNPGTSIIVYGYGYGQFGGGQLSPSSQSIDINAGQTISGIDWTINLPSAPPTGDIAGTVTLSGNFTPTYVSVTASGPSYANVTANPSYSMPNMYAGSYYMYGNAQFNSSYFYFPDSMFSPQRNVTVSGGATTFVDLAGNLNGINGVLTLGGTNTLADVSYGNLSVSGVYGNTSYGGSASANLPGNGGYSLVMSDGAWSFGNLSLQFSQTADPANYLYEQLYFYDYELAANPVTVSGGQTITKNLTYATGKVTINFQALGNATFSSPQLYASCSYIDPITNQTKWNYSAYAYNYSLQNVTEGGVTFVGMAGDCQVQASAYVNGSNYVTFGNLNITVVPDVIIIIDIGGPSLTVQTPAAGSLFTTASTTVTGIADDEVVDIASITVNGIAATFSSTNNPSRPHEVSFSATVPLSLGANTLTTVVTAEDTDEPGKTASDARAVYFDPGPLTLNWTPADGTSAPAGTVSVVVSGVASDPAGITEVDVNGQPVTITPTGNPGEVSFATTVPVNDGPNPITVTAKAIANQSITQTHTVTVTSMSPAIVTASGGVFTYSGSPHAGSGSATGGHGQSLPVTLTYTGTGSTSYGPTVAAPTNAGTYEVVAHTGGDTDTLPGDSAPAALIINKANASIIVGGYHTPYDGSAHTAIGSAKGVMLETLAGLDLSATVHTAVGVYNDPWTFTDVTGNYNNASGTVQSEIEPVAVSYTVCGVDGPNGPKNSGSTIPIKVKICNGSGATVSNVVVHATGIQLVSGTANGTLQDSGNANPGMNFRQVGPPVMYMFNLQTKGFKSGTYKLLFTIGSDSTEHGVQFQIK